MKREMTVEQRRTHRRVFGRGAAAARGPGVGWGELRSLLAVMADEVREWSNGHVRVRDGGREFVLYRESGERVAACDLMMIRHFLGRRVGGVAAAESVAVAGRAANREANVC